MSRLIGADRGGAGLSVAVAIALGVVTVPLEEHPVAAASTTQRGDAQVGDEDIDDVAGDVSYPGDGSAEAKLVAEEDARLLDVRSVISSAPWRDIDVSRSVPNCHATSVHARARAAQRAVHAAGTRG